MDGGAGNDALYGGAGADVFIFNAGDGSDKVYDFLNGTDRFQIGAAAEAFSDVRIIDSSKNVIIQFSDVSITLANVDHTVIGAKDFIFA